MLTVNCIFCEGNSPNDQTLLKFIQYIWMICDIRLKESAIENSFGPNRFGKVNKREQLPIY